MAGDWIKWVKGLPRKPEVLAMSSELNLDRHHVAGLLMVIWEWVDESVSAESRSDRDNGTATIRVGPLAARHIDSIAGVQGFADAMSSCGWIVIRNDHVAFPNFFRHNGSSAKDRALAANRQSRRRHGPVAEVSRPKRDKSVTREEKRREEDNPAAQGSATPDSAATPPAENMTAKSTEPPEPKPPRRQPDTAHHAAIAAFCDHWKAKYGVKYPFSGGKDGEAIRWMLGQCEGSVERFAGVVDRYLADPDPFYTADRHSLGLLRSKFARWLVDAPPAPQNPLPKTKSRFRSAAEIFAEDDAQKGEGGG